MVCPTFGGSVHVSVNVCVYLCMCVHACVCACVPVCVCVPACVRDILAVHCVHQPGVEAQRGHGVQHSGPAVQTPLQVDQVDLRSGGTEG